MNFLGGRVVASGDDGIRVQLAGAGEEASGAVLPVRSSADTRSDARVTLGIRPEHIVLDPSALPALRVAATIERIEQLGAASFLYCTLPSGERLTVHSPGQVGYASGSQVNVGLPLTHTHVFSSADGEPVVPPR